MTWREYWMRNEATQQVKRFYAPDLATAFELARSEWGSVTIACIST